jgi:hypothetical protein
MIRLQGRTTSYASEMLHMDDGMYRIAALEKVVLMTSIFAVVQRSANAATPFFSRCVLLRNLTAPIAAFMPQHFLLETLLTEQHFYKRQAAKLAARHF